MKTQTLDDLTPEQWDAVREFTTHAYSFARAAKDAASTLNYVVDRMATGELPPIDSRYPIIRQDLQVLGVQFESSRTFAQRLGITTDVLNEAYRDAIKYA